MSQRAARARARHNAEVDALRERVRAVVRERLPAGARAWLIGSLAWGTFGPRSDVDLVFDGFARSAHPPDQ